MNQARTSAAPTIQFIDELSYEARRNFGGWLPCFVQLITNTSNGQHVLRIFGIGFEFLSQAVYVRINVSLIAFVIGTPHTIQQRIAGPGSAWLRCKQFEDLKLERSQIDPFALTAYFVTTFIDYKIADLDSFAIFDLRACTGASQQSFNSIFQFAWTERLCKVVIG